MDIRDSEREWRRLGEDREARNKFLRGVLFLMSLFLGIVTLVIVLLAAFGGRSWDYVVVALIVDVVAILGLYGLIGLYMPFMYRLGKRWGERRRREGRVGFLDRPVGPRTKSR